MNTHQREAVELLHTSGNVCFRRVFSVAASCAGEAADEVAVGIEAQLNEWRAIGGTLGPSDQGHGPHSLPTLSQLLLLHVQT